MKVICSWSRYKEVAPILLCNMKLTFFTTYLIAIWNRWNDVVVNWAIAITNEFDISRAVCAFRHIKTFYDYVSLHWWWWSVPIFEAAMTWNIAPTFLYCWTNWTVFIICSNRPVAFPKITPTPEFALYVFAYSTQHLHQLEHLDRIDHFQLPSVFYSSPKNSEVTTFLKDIPSCSRMFDFSLMVSDICFSSCAAPPPVGICPRTAAVFTLYTLLVILDDVMNTILDTHLVHCDSVVAARPSHCFSPSKALHAGIWSLIWLQLSQIDKTISVQRIMDRDCTRSRLRLLLSGVTVDTTGARLEYDVVLCLPVMIAYMYLLRNYYYIRECDSTL